MANTEDKLGPIESPSPPIVNALATIDQWSFDIFNLADVTEGQPLKYLAYNLFNRYGIITKFKIDPVVLEKFLKKIEYGSNVHSNPFHNSKHASAVAQTMHYMLTTTGLTTWTSDLENFACLFAAVIHVYEHPGKTNNFQVMTNSDVALIYNDCSVNESYTVSLVYRLLVDNAYNILSNLSHEEFREMRVLVIDLVLSTNITYHFKQLEHMKTVLGSKHPKMKKGETLRLLLDCCNLSHPTKDWALHYRWAMSASDQAFNQGDKERELCLILSPACDRNTTSVAESQIELIDFIVKPGFQVLSDTIEFILNTPETSNRINIKKPWLPHIEENKAKWKIEAERRSSAAKAKESK